MCIYCGTLKYREIYKKHFGPIPKESNGRSYEIHHIDGNHSNNDPANLTAITIQEHYNIHYSQKDWNACLALGTRMKIDPSILSEIARTKTLEQVANGTHPWLGGKLVRKRVADGTHHLLGGEIQRKSNLIRVANGTHPWLNKEKQKAKALKQFADGKHPSQYQWTCCNCGKIGKGLSNFNRYHGENCQRKSPGIAPGPLEVTSNELLR